MSLALVSIIIPFYNEEEFLARAVCSALKQTYQRIEIILVNDGSSDRSLDIAQHFQQESEQIFIIDAVHHSLGKARNLGIEAAQGVYMLFLDSDDELDKSAVAQLVKKMDSEQADLVICKFGLYDASGRLSKTLGWDAGSEMLDNIQTISALYQHRIVYMAGGRLYKSAIVRKYYFPEGVWFEDTPFLLAYLLNVKKVSFEEQSLWKIHSRPTSITRHMIEKKRIEDVFRIFLLEWSLLKNSAYEMQLKRSFFSYQVQAFMLNLIFLCSDRKRIADPAELKGAFSYCLNEFYRHLKNASCGIGPRTRMNLAILSLYKYLGWDFTFRILPCLKRKQYRAVRLLRNA